MLYICDTHRRMTKLPHQVRIWFTCFNENGICFIISSYFCFKFQIFFWFCGSGRSDFFHMIKVCFYFGWSQITAIRKLDTIFQLNRPLCMFIIYFVTFCQPWCYFHIVIKFEQGFRNSVSHGIPSTIFIHGTIYYTICIHGTSKVQYLIFCICGNSHRQQCCGCCCNHHGFSFFVFHFLSPYLYLFVALL